MHYKTGGGLRKKDGYKFVQDMYKLIEGTIV